MREDREDRDEMKPSIGIRSDLLPLHPGLHDISGLPALEALRRQAGHNPFLSSLSPHGLSMPAKRPSQPPTPQSSHSGGDPSSAWSFEEQFKQVQYVNIYISIYIHMYMYMCCKLIFVYKCKCAVHKYKHKHIFINQNNFVYFVCVLNIT